jgi:hypothetical protein
VAVRAYGSGGGGGGHGWMCARVPSSMEKIEDDRSGHNFSFRFFL